MRGNYKHGGKGQRLYVIWKTMRQRCNNPKNQKYKNYGGRGISICDEWNDYASFREWAYENGYGRDLTIDRYDVNGDYTPDNCRWATLKEQANNKTNTHWIEDDGVEISMAEFCRRHDLNYKRFSALLQEGKSCEEARLLC